MTIDEVQIANTALIVRTNTAMLERVIQAVDDPKLIHSIDVSNGHKLRFSIGDVRFNVYQGERVTVVEGCVEIGNRPEAKMLEGLLQQTG